MTVLVNASVRIDSRFNEPYVSIEFDSRGAKIFERITKKNKQKRLAIILDDNVYSAPTIQGQDFRRTRTDNRTVFNGRSPRPGNSA